MGLFSIKKMFCVFLEGIGKPLQGKKRMSSRVLVLYSKVKCFTLKGLTLKGAGSP